MIIVHRTAAGEEFRALYGHVSGLEYKAGAARHGGRRHRDRQRLRPPALRHPPERCRTATAIPYAGHVPKSWKDHGGFVDPVKYLKANPRAATYVPPVLPVVRISTGSAPSRYGAVAGIAYWDEQVGGEAATYAYDLLGGTRRQLAPGETAPPFDDGALRGATARRAGARDLRPRPSAAARAGGATGFAAVGRLCAAHGDADQRRGQGVRLRAGRSSSASTGAAWAQVGQAAPTSDGTRVFTCTPASAPCFASQFLLPAAQPKHATYVAPESPEVTVAPKVRLSCARDPGDGGAGQRGHGHRCLSRRGTRRARGACGWSSSGSRSQAPG